MTHQKGGYICTKFKVFQIVKYGYKPSTTVQYGSYPTVDSGRGYPCVFRAVVVHMMYKK